jgi:hypothetical protein
LPIESYDFFLNAKGDNISYIPLTRKDCSLEGKPSTSTYCQIDIEKLVDKKILEKTVHDKTPVLLAIASRNAIGQSPFAFFNKTFGDFRQPTKNATVQPSVPQNIRLTELANQEFISISWDLNQTFEQMPIKSFDL